MKCQVKDCMEVAGDGGYCASHLPGDPKNWKKRASDGGFLCRLARVLSLGWDWVDDRQLDCWAVTIFTGAVTWKLTDWGMDFAMRGDRPGLEVAAILAAIGGPWALLQGACVKFVFDARKGSFTSS